MLDRRYAQRICCDILVIQLRQWDGVQFLADNFVSTFTCKFDRSYRGSLADREIGGDLAVEKLVSAKR